MKILAINSSDNLLSVALKVDQDVFYEQREVERNHNQLVLILIEKLLAEIGIRLNQISAVSFGEGPGSFTGLRIAAGVAQGIAYGLNVPVVPVSCMAAIAEKQESPRTITAVDAKRNRIYWGIYTRDSLPVVSLKGKEQLTDLSKLSVDGEGWFGAGSGWDLYAETLSKRIGLSLLGWRANQRPHAREIAILGAHYYQVGSGLQATYAIPKYLDPYFSN